jgi:signal transduction histidine kinase
MSGSASGRANTNWKQNTGLSLLLLVLVLLFSAIPVIRDWQLRLTDTFFRLAPAPRTPSQVVLVVIDDESLRQFGRWPWPRPLLARLVDNLNHGGASVIGLDILLSEPQSTDADKVLADALRTSQRAVIVDKIGSFPDGPHWIEPLPEFTQAAAAVGHAHALLDVDSVCRRFPPHELSLDGARWAFAVEVARRADVQRTLAFLSSYGIPSADDTSAISVAKPELVRIPFRTDGFREISAAAMLGSYDQSLIRGKPVLVGFGPTEIGDRLSTPLTTEYPTAGVAVHAEILDSILTGRTVRDLSSWASVLVLLLACLAVVVTFRTWRGWIAIGLFFVIATLTYVAGLVVLIAAARILPAGSMLLAVLIGPMLVYAADFVMVERSVAQQLLGMRSWLSRHTKTASSDERAELSWKLDLLQQLQTELGSLYELHKTLLESTQDLVAIFDHRGKLLLSNRSFADAYQPDPERGLTLEQLMDRLTPAGADSPQGPESEVYLDKELYSLRLVPLPPTTLSPSGGTIATFTSLRTRTERDRARSEALGFITHELRTPLSSIQGFAELMMRYPSSPSSTGAPETIFRESKRLLALINSYLDVLRLDAGAKPLGTDIMEIDEVVGLVFEILQPLAEPARMRLVFESADRSPFIGDAQLITGAILNLVSNAIKYGLPGTEIRVRCSRQDADVVIGVQNVGEPIALEEIPRLFDPYYRASNVETSKTGWGLGLAFVKRIAEKHGGRVSVSSQSGVSLFQIHLPAKTTVEAAKEAV